MASGSRANASATSRASPTAVRAHCPVALARPHAGLTPSRSRSAERGTPSRSVTATAAAATSSIEGARSGAVTGTRPSTTVRPDSTNAATASKSAACSVLASTDTALILLRCSRSHGKSGLQLCSATSASTAAMQVSSSASATVSSSGATGLNAVTPVSRRPTPPATTLVELHHHRCVKSTRQRRAMRGNAFGQRGGQVTHGSGVGDRPVTVGQLQPRDQCDWPGRLHLHRPPTATQARGLPGLF